MSEIKITKNSLENAILRDGQFVSGYISEDDNSIDASGYGSHAEGYAESGSIIANGNGTHAEGISTIASGNASHAEGRQTIAYGTGAHAEGSVVGFKTTITVQFNGTSYTIIEGTISSTGIRVGSIIKNGTIYTIVNTISGSTTFSTKDPIHDPIHPRDNVSVQVLYGAGGQGAHTEGNNTIASGYSAHAEGRETSAIAAYAHAGGYGTIANQDAMTAIGKYNVSSNTVNTLFVVGDGSISLRSNAFKVNSLGSNIEKTNLVPSSVQAKVNGVSDVYLGCPIGTIVMWAGETEPEGWLLCNGRGIALANPYGNVPEAKVRSGFEIYQNLVDVIKNKYGANIGYPGSGWVPGNIQNGAPYVLIPNLQQRFPLGAKEDDQWQCGNKIFNTSLGKDGGEKQHTLSINEMPIHNHDWQIQQGDEKRGGWNANSSLNGSTGTFEGNRTNLRHTGSDGEGEELLFNSADPNDTTTHRFENIAKVGGTAQLTILDAGGDQPHNNIPPYLAINFIIKYK